MLKMLDEKTTGPCPVFRQGPASTARASRIRRDGSGPCPDADAERGAESGRLHRAFRRHFHSLKGNRDSGLRRHALIVAIHGIMRDGIKAHIPKYLRQLLHGRDVPRPLKLRQLIGIIGRRIKILAGIDAQFSVRVALIGAVQMIMLPCRHAGGLNGGPDVLNGDRRIAGRIRIYGRRLVEQILLLIKETCLKTLHIARFGTKPADKPSGERPSL